MARISTPRETRKSGGGKQEASSTFRRLATTSMLTEGRRHTLKVPLLASRPPPVETFTARGGRKSGELDGDDLEKGSYAMRVFVRVRPWNVPEGQRTGSATGRPSSSQRHDVVAVQSETPQFITVLDPSKGFAPKDTYVFERCFTSVTPLFTPRESFDPGDMALSCADQELVYAHVGRPVLQSTMDGYNGCVFAYGQTGSGKTYTMMGPASLYGVGLTAVHPQGPKSAGADSSFTSPRVRAGKSGMSTSPSLVVPTDRRREACAASRGSVTPGRTPRQLARPTGLPTVDPDLHQFEGIIPRLVRELFVSLHQKHQSDSTLSFRVEMEYFEIYNEKVMDLLHTNAAQTERRVRNSSLGPYVENLTRAHVSEASEVFQWVHQGNLERHTATTKLNDRSSRGHAILTLHVTQMRIAENDTGSRVISKINLVDLAGSERTGASGVEGLHFKEAAKINLSLTTLGRVIDVLADLSQGKPTLHCPYRDSNLTWLLMDSLGGNSRTTMVATISPHPTYFEESCQTLRYASRAKQIMMKAVVNEDPQARQIRLLLAEVGRLQRRLDGEDTTDEYVEELRDRLSLAEAELTSKKAELEEVRRQLTALRQASSAVDPAAKRPRGVSQAAPYELDKLRSELQKAREENEWLVGVEDQLRSAKELSQRLGRENSVLLRKVEKATAESRSAFKRAEQEGRRLDSVLRQMERYEADLKAAESREEELIVRLRQATEEQSRAVAEPVARGVTETPRVKHALPPHSTPRMAEDTAALHEGRKGLPRRDPHTVASLGAFEDSAALPMGNVADATKAPSRRDSGDVHQRRDRAPMGSPTGRGGGHDVEWQQLRQQLAEKSTELRTCELGIRRLTGELQKQRDQHLSSSRLLQKEHEGVVLKLKAEIRELRQKARLSQRTIQARLAESADDLVALQRGGEVEPMGQDGAPSKGDTRHSCSTGEDENEEHREAFPHPGCAAVLTSPSPLERAKRIAALVVEESLHRSQLVDVERQAHGFLQCERRSVALYDSMLEEMRSRQLMALGHFHAEAARERVQNQKRMQVLAADLDAAKRRLATTRGRWKTDLEHYASLMNSRAQALGDYTLAAQRLFEGAVGECSEKRRREEVARWAVEREHAASSARAELDSLRSQHAKAIQILQVQNTRTAADLAKAKQKVQQQTASLADLRKECNALKATCSAHLASIKLEQGQVRDWKAAMQRQEEEHESVVEAARQMWTQETGAVRCLYTGVLQLVEMCALDRRRAEWTEREARERCVVAFWKKVHALEQGSALVAVDRQLQLSAAAEQRARDAEVAREELQQRHERARETVLRLEDAVQCSEAQVRGLEERLAASVADGESASRRADELQKGLEQARRQVATLQASVTQGEARREGDTHAHELALTELRRQSEDVDARLREAQAREVTLTQRLAERDAEMGRLAGTHLAAEQRLGEVEGEARELRGAVGRLQGETQVLQEAVERATLERDSLEGTLQAVASQTAAQEAAARRRREALETECAALRTAHAHQLLALAEGEAARGKLVSQWSDTMEERARVLETTRGERNAARAHAVSLETQQAEQQAALAALSERLRHTQDGWNGAAAEVEALQAQMAHQQAQSTAALQRATASLQEVQAELAHTQSAHATALTALREESEAALLASAAHGAATHARLEAAHATLQAAHAALETRLAAAHTAAQAAAWADLRQSETAAREAVGRAWWEHHGRLQETHHAAHTAQLTAALRQRDTALRGAVVCAADIAARYAAGGGEGGAGAAPEPLRLLQDGLRQLQEDAARHGGAEAAVGAFQLRLGQNWARERAELEEEIRILRENLEWCAGIHQHEDEPAAPPVEELGRRSTTPDFILGSRWNTTARVAPDSFAFSEAPKRSDGPVARMSLDLMLPEEEPPGPRSLLDLALPSAVGLTGASLPL